MSDRRLISFYSAIAALVLLCLLFFFLPDGWNALPLFLLALVLLGLWNRRKSGEAYLEWLTIKRIVNAERML